MICKLKIWGRTFNLPVIYQNFPGENVTDNQIQTVKSIENIDLSESKAKVIQYIKNNNASELTEEDITNIFKYVIPKSLLIPRIPGKQLFAVMCNYRFDMEHGLAIVFENGRCKAVSLQDIVL